MTKFEEFKKKIKLITSDQCYEGDFGDVIEDVDLILSEISDPDKKIDFPKDYLHFIQTIGFGDLDASFYMNDGPSHYTTVFSRKIPELDGMFVFASDQSEYLFAFDSLNNWQIVDIDSSGNVENIISSSFIEFIDIKLKELLEILSWRANE